VRGTEVGVVVVVAIERLRSVRRGVPDVVDDRREHPCLQSVERMTGGMTSLSADWRN
jgi:hypothetical protein